MCFVGKVPAEGIVALLEPEVSSAGVVWELRFPVVPHTESKIGRLPAVGCCIFYISCVFPLFLLK